MSIKSITWPHKNIAVLAIICLGWSISLVCAADVNSSPVSNPYITIDPIGNHTVGDVFFINGTTNLPVTEPLRMNIYRYDTFCCSTIPGHSSSPGCSGLSFYNVAEVSGFSKSPDLSGPNQFSINVTEKIKNFANGDYVVFVCSNQTCSDGLAKNQEACLSGSSGAIPQKDYFTLFPATNTSPTTIPRTITPSSASIQPTSNQTIVPISTQLSPLPLVLPIVVLITVVILRSNYWKKRD